MGSGASGDGGYQERQDKMKAEQDAAIQSINSIFGKGDGAPIYTETQVPGSWSGGGSSPGVSDQPAFGPDGRGQTWFSGDSDGGNGGGAGSWIPPSTVRSISGYDTAARDKNAAEREKLYGTISTDSEARLLDSLGQDRSKAERAVRFQLARQGLMGGSADVDQGAELLGKFQEGSLDAHNSATASADSARSADEKTRVGLINNIRSGMGQSDALSAAYAGMSNNANQARNDALATDIGGFFDDLSILNNNIRYQQGMANTQNKYGSGGVTSSAANGGFNGGIT